MILLQSFIIFASFKVTMIVPLMVFIQLTIVFTLNISYIKSLSYDVHYSIFPNLHSVQLLSLKNV